MTVQCIKIYPLHNFKQGPGFNIALEYKGIYSMQMFNFTNLRQMLLFRAVDFSNTWEKQPAKAHERRKQSCALEYGQEKLNGYKLSLSALCHSWVAALMVAPRNEVFGAFLTDCQYIFDIWLRFPLLTLGRIKSQTFCNCPWDWTGHFHHGKKLKWNEWHILVYGNDICGAQWQPARARSNLKKKKWDFSVCMGLY